MEKDYIKFSQEELDELDKLNISYRWRDSCVGLLKESKQCRETFKYTGMFRCRDVENRWLDCQIEREKEIIMVENLKPIPWEQRKND